MAFDIYWSYQLISILDTRSTNVSIPDWYSLYCGNGDMIHYEITQFHYLLYVWKLDVLSWDYSAKTRVEDEKNKQRILITLLSEKNIWNQNDGLLTVRSIPWYVSCDGYLQNAD